SQPRVHLSAGRGSVLLLPIFAFAGAAWPRLPTYRFVVESVYRPATVVKPGTRVLQPRAEERQQQQQSPGPRGGAHRPPCGRPASPIWNPWLQPRGGRQQLGGRPPAPGVQEQSCRGGHGQPGPLRRRQARDTARGGRGAEQIQVHGADAFDDDRPAQRQLHRAVHPCPPPASASSPAGAPGPCGFSSASTTPASTSAPPIQPTSGSVSPNNSQANSAANTG